jgi:hypothetical protein
MKKYLLILGLVFLSCSTFAPTPDDFPPPPPMTVIVEIPPVTPTTTIEPRSAPITQENMLDAQNFHLILVTRLAAGDSIGIAETVKYPITVNIDGLPITISSVSEFETYYDQIFTDNIIEAVTDTSEENLLLLPEGIRIGHGEVWFNLYCVDLTCSDTQFLITQINN